MRGNSKVTFNGIEMSREFKALNHPVMGSYQSDYADWHIKKESERIGVNYSEVLQTICSCLHHKISKKDIISIIKRKFFVEVSYHISKKLNGGYNIVIDKAEKAFVL